MPLSLSSAIAPAEIQEMKSLGTHANVWLLTGFNEDKIVVKSEMVEAVQVKSANVGIKAVAPSARVKVLSNDELNAIDQFISNFEEAEKEYQALGMPLSAGEARAAKDFKAKRRKANSCFVKMEPVNVTDLAEALVNRLDGDKGDLRAFTATLNAQGGLERLGKIIAVDLFIHNEDRFWPSDDGRFSMKPLVIGRIETAKTRCLVNVGNVFQIETENGAEVGALDFIYQGWDINKPLAECERGGQKWGGRYLADKIKRDGFAKDVAHDLEIILNPHRSRFSLKTKLKEGAASRIASGMVVGAELIKRKLEGKYNPNRWTQGAKDRYLIMCQVR